MLLVLFAMKLIIVGVILANMVIRMRKRARVPRLAITENCIVFATTGHARFEHARVLNNKMRAIQGFGIC